MIKINKWNKELIRKIHNVEINCSNNNYLSFLTLYFIEYWSGKCIIYYKQYKDSFIFLIFHEDSKDVFLFFLGNRELWDIQHKHAREFSRKVCPNSKIYLLGIDKNDRNLITDLKYDIHSYNKTEEHYIYSRSDLEYFIGKKYQKKRNLLNYFNKNYKNESKITILKNIDIDDTLEFINNWENIIVDMKKDSNFIKPEINIIKNIIKSDNLKDILDRYILKLNGKITGIIFLYRASAYFELIWTWVCDKSIKGAYQFLLSECIKKLDSNVKFVSFLDHADDDSLKKSKKSYYPINIEELYDVLWSK